MKLRNGEVEYPVLETADAEDFKAPVERDE